MCVSCLALLTNTLVHSLFLGVWGISKTNPRTNERASSGFADC